MKLIVKIAFLLVIMAAASTFIPSYLMRGINELRQRNIPEVQELAKRQKEDTLRDQELQRLLAIKENQQKEKAQRLAHEKQQAWYAWYSKREEKGCDNWQSDRHMVECTNKKMDLKSEFKKVWNSQHRLSQK